MQAFSVMIYKPSELGQLCLAVMICAILVNTQTHRQTAFDRLHY